MFPRGLFKTKGKSSMLYKIYECILLKITHKARISVLTTFTLYWSFHLAQGNILICTYIHYRYCIKLEAYGLREKL